MKRRLVILLGLSIISTSAFGVTTFAEAEDAAQTTEAADGAEENVLNR